MTMFVDATDQTGSSFELKELSNSHARKESSKPALTAIRLAFLER